MEPTTLILTVGLPKSGKTTWARKQPYPIVNPDAIRLALHAHDFLKRAEPYVWAIAETMIRHHFAYGHSIAILDATNITPQRREQWMSSDWDTKFVVFDTPYSACRKRAEAMGFPIEVLDRMSREMILPNPGGHEVLEWIEEDK